MMREINYLAFNMHLALSTILLTLLSANIIVLSDAMSVISFSPILATILGSNPAKASLCYKAKYIYIWKRKKREKKADEDC